MTEKYLLIGGSRGIGAAAAKHLVESGHDIVSVSRTPSEYGTWLKADVSNAGGIETIAEAIGDDRLDALLYLGGIWENGAFTDDYEFLQSSDDETRNVISVNLIAPIELLKTLKKNLKKSENPRAIFIGSLSGLENSATPEVANTASKFGLRGAVEAMRLSFSIEGIALTVINPDNVETDEVIADIAEGKFAPQIPIPLSDLIAAIDCALSMSPASEIRILDIAQRYPGN